MNTQLSNLYAMTEDTPEKRKYDEAAKNILSNRYILAHILKHLVEDVRDCSIEEIISFMDGLPIVSKVPVPPILRGENLESKLLGEGTVFYDVRFSIFPNGDRKCRIFFDVESQKDYYPGYSIPTRGIFYGARMLSEQLESEFSPPDYDQLKKVYSIWVCLDPAKYIGNAISEFFIDKRDILGHIPCRQEDYDKLRVIQICLQPETPGTEHPVIRLLNTSFSRKSRNEIDTIMEEEFQIPPEEGIGREVEIMCNLSDLIEEQGIQKGIEQGIEQGALITIRQALDNGMEETAVKQYLNATDEQIEQAKRLVLKA